MNDFQDSFIEEEEDDMCVDTDIYSFYYSGSGFEEGEVTDRDIEDHVMLPFDATWTQVLSSFLSFLSQVYGYDVKEQVAVQYNPYRDPTEWNGKTFGQNISTDQWVQLDLFDAEKHNYGGSD